MKTQRVVVALVLIFIFIAIFLINNIPKVSAGYYENEENIQHGYCGYTDEGRPIDGYEIVKIKEKNSKTKISRYWCGSRYIYRSYDSGYYDDYDNEHYQMQQKYSNQRYNSYLKNREKPTNIKLSTIRYNNYGRGWNGYRGYYPSYSGGYWW